MKKWWLLVAVLVVLAAGAAGVVLEPTGVVWGRLRGEAFFDGRPTGSWRRALKDHDPTVHVRTLDALKKGGPAAVPVLVALLRDGEAGWAGAEVRWTAAELLGQIGEPAADAVPALVTALSDPDAHVRAV